MTSTVSIPYRKTRQVKNLGWLIRNRNNHGGIHHVSVEVGPPRGDRKFWDGWLVVYFEDVTIYRCKFVSLNVLLNWILQHLLRWIDDDNLAALTQQVEGGYELHWKNGKPFAFVPKAREFA